ncbi:RNA polymerase sigma-70 factor [Fodinibius salsisoli]|uniref:RNA polymerase sigma-70 factor n=1 Tax=Fodinibius salsisoli TaxID=2820877 RepID=A0ABT3PQH4_9BACT|nr:RNA polymerase sigma-70 factor [Fodinibius salsisoli]MCW9708117.1 RNA polymerase sigma-70 factor [Fodinibius salsisoli]
MSDLAFKSNKGKKARHSERRRDRFEHFFKRHYPDLCSFVFSYVNDREVAKDIVQSVFLRVWEQKRFWDNHEDAKAYFYKSVRNEALNHKKHEQVKQKADTEVRLRVSEWKINDKTAQVNDRRVEIIQKGINDLPARCREIFNLSRYDGLTYKEIAEVLDISVKTVETQIGRALKKLRRFTKEHVKESLLILVAFFSM